LIYRTLGAESDPELAARWEIDPARDLVKLGV
jgi:hypothetical protein